MQRLFIFTLTIEKHHFSNCHFSGKTFEMKIIFLNCQVKINKEAKYISDNVVMTDVLKANIIMFHAQIF